MTAKSDRQSLTQKEIERLALAFRCMTEVPKIDMVEFGRLTGLAPNSIGPQWSRLMSKVRSLAIAAAGEKDEDGGEASVVPSKPETSRKRKNDGGLSAESSGKKAKKNGVQVKVKPEADEDGDDDCNVEV